MERVSIRTSQNVGIDYEVAGIGDRILATLLDYLFLFAYFLICMLIFSSLELGYNDHYIAILSIMALPVFFYDLICELMFNGRSFGKMIMKIKVAKLDGSQPGFGSYLIRWAFRLIDTRLGSGVIAVLAVAFSEKGQRLGDMAAGTTVVKLKKRVSLRDTILYKAKPGYEPTFPSVVELSDKDVQVIKEVMETCISTKNWAGLDKLSKKTKELTGITTEMPHIQFLKTVISDYNHFAAIE